MQHQIPKRRKEILPFTLLFLINKKLTSYCFILLAPTTVLLCYALINIIKMRNEIFSKLRCPLKWSVRTRNNPTGCTILPDQWRKILYDQSQATCEINVRWTKCHCFSCLLRRLAEGNESRQCAICCFLRITIFKVCRCKLSQQSGDFLCNFWNLYFRQHFELIHFL